MLQEAEDNCYITAKYLLELAKRAYDLFVRSEVEERRQLIKLVLSDLRVEGKIARYDWTNPFDKIAFYASRQAWLRTSCDIIKELNINKNLKSFQNVAYIGVLRQRWEEIKKLNSSPKVIFQQIQV